MVKELPLFTSPNADATLFTTLTEAVALTRAGGLHALLAGHWSARDWLAKRACNPPARDHAIKIG